MLLAIIGAGASSFIFVLHYLDLRDGNLSIWLNEGLLFIAALSLFDYLFYLFAGLYGVCYAKKPEKAKNCIIWGWILLAGAVRMFFAGCVLVMNSAWLLVESVGKLVILPVLLRFALAVSYS